MNNTLKQALAGITLMLICVALVALYMVRTATIEPTAVNQCGDGIAVQYAADGTLYGDQDNDGILSGIDCDWK